ncbi:MAG: hypothetical protein ACR2G3_01385 [Solirubrobacterales bacterium]
MKRLIICLAASTALAVPASAAAAEQFYGGKIEGGGKIGVDVTWVNGKPFQVDAMRYRGFPANCTGGNFLIGSTWDFNAATVNDNRFTIDGGDGMGSKIFFKGRFRRQGRKLVGEIKEGPSTFGGEAGTCTTAKRGYTARRGDDGPHPQKMKARVHEAFRVD